MPGGETGHYIGGHADRMGDAMSGLLLFLALQTQAPGYPTRPRPLPEVTPAAVRDSLRLADQRVSELSAANGFGPALLASILPDAVLVFEGAPVVRGEADIRKLLGAQAGLPAVSWAPYRVLVSTDGTVGVTFGGMTVGGKTAPARYITAWQRDAGGRWKIAAHMHNGARGPEVEVITPSGLGAVTAGGESDRFSRVDRDFAKLAGDSGAPAAFARYASPDGMTFASTGELNLGPAAVAARLAEGRAGTAQWRWHPVFSIGAPSGDLGITVGEAEITLGGSESTSFYSKYLTVWQRQPDGTLKFVVDGGNSRPPR